MAAPSWCYRQWRSSVYVADRGNSTIRKVTRTGPITTVAGVAGERHARPALIKPMPGDSLWIVAAVTGGRGGAAGDTGMRG